MTFEESNRIYETIMNDQSNFIYLVVYVKDNCPACKDTIPKIKYYLLENGYFEKQVQLIEIHTSTLTTDQIQERQLRSAPTMHVFQNGEFVGGIRGGLGTTPYEYLDSELGSILQARLPN